MSWLGSIGRGESQDGGRGREVILAWYFFFHGLDVGESRCKRLEWWVAVG